MLSSTFALAYTNHHKHRTYQGSYARMQPAPNYGWNNNYGWTNRGWNGNPNNRGGLVGGGDNGTFRY